MTSRPRIAVRVRVTRLLPGALTAISPRSKDHVSFITKSSKGGGANGLKKKPVEALWAGGTSGSNHSMTITN